MKPIIAVPGTIALCYRAWSRKSLTPAGIVAAAITAIVHAIHPWSAPFFLLVVFYLGATTATKVKHDVKAQLTMSSAGTCGGEGPRTHVQVFANSIVASVLVLLHTRRLALDSSFSDQDCFSFGRSGADLLAVGIVANYAAVTADTFASELGILSKSKPRLITSPTLRVVPPGTNGGVTAAGTLASLFGALTIALTSVVLLPFCGGEQYNHGWGLKEQTLWVVSVTLWGVVGSLVDSILGGLLQASVMDKRTGKIVEGSGGQKVLVHPASTKPSATVSSSVDKDSSALRATQAVANTVTMKGANVIDPSSANYPSNNESRQIEAGYDLLDNNAVNLFMAVIASVAGMAVASYVWGVPLRDILS